LSSAEALEFIHEKAEPCITPRVIKSSDILLFDNDVAKIIGDVGVFESDPDATIDPSKTYRYHPSTALSCYCAPEYATKIPYISVISDSSTRLGIHILSC
jgi:pto-interacting protein 1